jgi:hypothetical protein
VGKVQPKKKQGPCPLPEALATTEYVVILDHSARTPSSLHTIDPSKFVRATQDKLRAVRSPLNLLSGRWSAPNSFCKNFVFVFAGKLAFADISKFDSILFDPFGPRCHGVPNSGFVSQPSIRAIVSLLIVLIVRTPLLIAPYPVCVPPPSVVTVTTPVPDSLLSLMDYCFPSVYCSIYLVYLLIVSTFLLCGTLYCSCVFYCFLLPFILYCSLRLTALDGLTT